MITPYPSGDLADTSERRGSPQQRESKHSSQSRPTVCGWARLQIILTQESSPVSERPPRPPVASGRELKWVSPKRPHGRTESFTAPKGKQLRPEEHPDVQRVYVRMFNTRNRSTPLLIGKGVFGAISTMKAHPASSARADLTATQAPATAAAWPSRACWLVFAAAIVVSVFIHELGHCTVAWLHGCPAIPTPAKEYILKPLPEGVQNSDGARRNHRVRGGTRCCIAVVPSPAGCYQFVDTCRRDDPSRLLRPSVHACRAWA